MPRKIRTQEAPGASPQEVKEPVFSPQEWLQKVKEKVMSQPWGTAVLKNAGALRLEIVRVGETDNIMVRIAGNKPGNAVKLTRREHVEALLELVEAIAQNYNNLQEKLEAVKQILPRSGRADVEEV